VESLKKKIEAIILDQKTGQNLPLAALLSITSRAYGQITKLRQFSYRKNITKSKRLPCMVISIGNIALGGTGKTPVTIYLAELLKRLGYTVVILSRGYKGTAEQKGGLVSDGRQLFMTPEEAGDEPFMMAGILNDVPIFVGSNRFENGRTAMERFQPNVILLDDGFQHFQLKRDIDLVLLDHANPLGNGRLLPRGPLREPVNALARGDAFIVTRSDHRHTDNFSNLLENQIKNKPVFKSRHIPYIRHVWGGNTDSRIEPDCIKGKNVFAFSGIARNHDFRNSLKEFTFVLKGFSEFMDHHPYKKNDLAAICREAMERKADFLVTTEKDFSRISHDEELPLPLVVMGVNISFDDQASEFENFILKRLTKGDGKK
jgi:tetraacyldisaccharide 4'-kinase